MNLIKYGTFAFVFYLVYLSINSLAGKTTVASFIFNILTEIKIENWIFLAFGLIGIIYGIVQKRLKNKKLKKMMKRIDELERIINPDKQSSKEVEGAR